MPSIFSSPGTITTTGSNTTIAYPYNWFYPHGTLITGTGTGTTTMLSNDTTVINPLSNMRYIINFDKNIEKFELLEDYVKAIVKNKFLFDCHYIGNRIQPYELIMRLINKKEIFSVKIEIYDAEGNPSLTINYINVQFTKIENNLNFDYSKSNCDFSVLKVKFKCEKILHQNHLLTQRELRADKLKKIKEYQDE